jgi:hypothetical protein
MLFALLALSGASGIFAAGTIFSPPASPHADYYINQSDLWQLNLPHGRLQS